MQSPNDNQADTTAQVATPPLGRTPSESVRVRKEQQGAVQFCARLGRTPTETQEMLSSAYKQDALRKPVTKTYHKRFETLGVDVYKSNSKSKKQKTTGDKKPSIDQKKSEENGKAHETDNGEQEKMNEDQADEDHNTSNKVEGENQPQPDSVPQEAKKDSSEKSEHSSEKSEKSSDSPQVNKTSEEGSTEKVEGATEA